MGRMKLFTGLVLMSGEKLPEWALTSPPNNGCRKLLSDRC